MITPTLLQQLCYGLSAAKAQALADGMNAAFPAGGITTPARIAAFVAQMAHETCGFKYSEELWGPTPAQRRYEGRRDLGNTQPGDGFRFKGRGWIQLTGRHNYTLYSKRVGCDLVASPELAARPDIAARVAVCYWADRGLNELADAGNFREITRRINGGYNGWNDRLGYYERAKGLLGQASAPILPNVKAVILIDGGGKEVKWNGKPTTYGGIKLDAAQELALRQMYKVPGGPWAYQGIRVFLRQNGDLVLDKSK